MTRIILCGIIMPAAALFAACGGDDKGTGADIGAGHEDGGATADAGPANVSVADSATATAGELGPEFEGFGAEATLLAATSMALEDDEVIAAIDVAPPPRPPRLLAGSDCVKKSVMTGVIELDYAACPHAKGMISLVRQELGTWLIGYNDGFSIFGVAVKGFMIVTRKTQGDFSLFTSDDAGDNQGTTAVRLSWQGKTAVVERDVYLIGRLLSIDAPGKLFDLTGDGFVGRQGATAKLKLGVGGAPDKTKDAPIEFPRPLDARCPNVGIIRLVGLFSAPAKAVVTFTVRDTQYPLAVDLGNVIVDGDFAVRFDKTQANGIGTLGLSEEGAIKVNGADVTGPVPVTDTGVFAALGSSTLAADVKAAIKDFATKHKDKLPAVPISDVVSGLVEAFKTQYADGFCAAQ